MRKRAAPAAELFVRCDSRFKGDGRVLKVGGGVDHWDILCWVENFLLDLLVICIILVADVSFIGPRAI